MRLAGSGTLNLNLTLNLDLTRRGKMGTGDLRSAKAESQETLFLEHISCSNAWSLEHAKLSKGLLLEHGSANVWV